MCYIYTIGKINGSPFETPLWPLVGVVIFQRDVCDVMSLNGDSCAFTVALQTVDAATIESLPLF